jgi:hypothetical protein
MLDVEIRDNIRVSGGSNFGIARFELAKKWTVLSDLTGEQLDCHAPTGADVAMLFIVSRVNITDPAAPDSRIQSIAAGDQSPIRAISLLLVR